MKKSLVLLILFAMLMPSALLAKRTWKLRGTLKAKHLMPLLSGKYGTSALKNVEVRVKGSYKITKKKWGPYGSWGTVRTNSSGVFSLTKKKSKKARRFKVEVKFEDKKVLVKKSKWITVYSSSRSHNGPSVDFGHLIFKEGGRGELGKRTPRVHADIWVAAHLLVRKMASYGYPYKSKLRVKYPSNTVAKDSAESSFANPATKVINLFRAKNGSRDHADVRTLYHEAMHIWAYQHCWGELGLAMRLLIERTTHGLVKKSFVAFHEGFAEFGKDVLVKKIFNVVDAEKPYTRHYLNNDVPYQPITNLDKLNRHDYGWRSIFHMLILNNLEMYSVGTKSSPNQKFAYTVSIRKKRYDSPRLNFRDILKSFQKAKSKGYKSVIKKKEMSLTPYLKRLAAICPGFKKKHIKAIKEVLNPAGTKQPADVF